MISALEAYHRGVRPVIRSSLERMFLTRLFTVSSVIESSEAICLFCIPRGNQAQDANFRR